MKLHRPENLCLVTAVDAEYDIAAHLLDSRSVAIEHGLTVCRGRAGNMRVSLLRTRIGAPDFTGRFGELLAANGFDAVIVAGFAGALSEELAAGQPLVYDRCLAFKEMLSARDEIESIPCDPEISRFVFDSLARAGTRAGKVTGLSLNRIVIRSREKVALGLSCGAGAVDMESFDIVSACSGASVPVAVLRVVSDSACRDLPDFNRAVRPDGTMSPLRIARAMLASPLVSARFIIDLRGAVSSLRRCLRNVLYA